MNPRNDVFFPLASFPPPWALCVVVACSCCSKKLEHFFLNPVSFFFIYFGGGRRGIKKTVQKKKRKEKKQQKLELEKEFLFASESIVHPPMRISELILIVSCKICFCFFVSVSERNTQMYSDIWHFCSFRWVISFFFRRFSDDVFVET